MTKTVLLLLALTIAAAGCKTPTLVKDTEYEELLRRAENEVRLAAQTGFVWSDTEARLAEAKTAHAGGERDKAARLAQTVIDEAVQAQLQARAATKVKPDFSYRP